METLSHWYLRGFKSAEEINLNGWRRLANLSDRTFLRPPWMMTVWCVVMEIGSPHSFLPPCCSHAAY